MTTHHPLTPAPRHQFGTPEHRDQLITDAKRQFAFFNASLRSNGGFHVLGHDGTPLSGTLQELHTTTRLTHAYALGKLAGLNGCDAVIDAGMDHLWSHHRDADHGGYLWALDGDAVQDDRKLAYGHVFVLLAGASAKLAGHPDADRLIDDVTNILEQKFWEDDAGLFADEWNRDWSPFSTYRGMNANMHGVEALLTAYEATGRDRYLEQAGRILAFFIGKIGPSESWRLPEHYMEDWQVDRGYSGNPMFRPAGTTPGHSFELARLLLQYWDLRGRPDDGSYESAWALTERAWIDAWDVKKGGLFYTLDFGGAPAIRDRYWWPVTEAIGVLANFLKLDGSGLQNDWYSRLWQFADIHFIDHERGGWYPEIDATGQPTVTQFNGKPDIYHSIQACLFPLTPGLSSVALNLGGILEN
ncbi:Mannose or cellobiose epimerase, N-acyl-D-glucosamine 2-epimerase family [Aliiroseovarius sediminilitoris]|uniref:Mannose or cellobiose epimerase, N-acyl-D-glucosamine 2-epimerase family n=1 Tax=Aliiroseovarius sediminilitoris TaxID=1173584 RepID=A0A1I0QWB8_9RHOB|nr:AGE family epimerase/isomerase [Aliiroseovarius sediminilitoris]SEW32055.1 Mannose or cellobiose epimerase, N-acyl-D-glucosamine 2-epimerase family [Aliiroseovarius sediminilitoris]